jgi:hypothetical protein
LNAAIRLHLMPEAVDRDGEPRAALVVPPTPSRYDRRIVTLLFSSVAAALAAKRDMERAEPSSRASTP